MPSLFNLQFKTEGVPSTEVVQISITVNDVKYVAVQDDKVKNKHKVRQVLWPRKTLALVRIQSLNDARFYTTYSIVLPDKLNGLFTKHSQPIKVPGTERFGSCTVYMKWRKIRSRTSKKKQAKKAAHRLRTSNLGKYIGG
mmetsp:Transcript_22023/g.24612  ORF Transcript_22023/g.24612 Transcript_22023/m.24612 type:complete len:140 (-) Transcript_22023:158-577(-)